jgi:hypothetical protein
MQTYLGSQRDCRRCIALVRSTRRRCKKTTCLTSEYCYPHLKQLKGLRVKKSNIPDAGYGLFTTVSREDEDKIDDYFRTNNYMKIQTRDQIHQKYGKNVGPYVLCNDDDECFDALSSQSCLARYTNACVTPTTRRRCNSEFNNEGELRILGEVRANDELLVDYGREYWNPAIDTSSNDSDDSVYVPQSSPRSYAS